MLVGMRAATDDGVADRHAAMASGRAALPGAWRGRVATPPPPCTGQARRPDPAGPACAAGIDGRAVRHRRPGHAMRSHGLDPRAARMGHPADGEGPAGRSAP
ncbi:hypothetical protein CKO45_21650, partial [Paracraurococcus ruber]|nr:hypothetical protein [Paracraurococcus ruber]